MNPIITQGEYAAIYATFTFDDQATMDVNLCGRKVVGLIVASDATLGSATSVDIIPAGVGATSTGSPFGMLTVGVAYFSALPRLDNVTITFNANFTGNLTLILE